MPKGFLDHKVFNDLKETSIHRHNATIVIKDIARSKLRAHLAEILPIVEIKLATVIIGD